MPPPEQTFRVVRERDRRRLRTMALVLGLSACLVGSALGVVWLKVQQVRLAYRLDALRTVKIELEDLNRQLRIELATLRSLARIEEKARAELGMVPPVPGQVRMAREFVAGGAPDAEGVGRGAASLRTAWEARGQGGRQPR